jgi:integrase
VAFDLLKGLRAKCDGKGLVFSERGMSHIRVCHAFSKICDEIGLPDVTMHTLRHTFATRLARRGDVNMEQVRKLMGHSDMRMTQRYSHLDDVSLRETVGKLKTPSRRPNAAEVCRDDDANIEQGG